MENLQSRCIELLKEKFSNVIKTFMDAKFVFDELDTIVNNDEIETFIKENLCVFSNRNDALQWFLSDDDDVLELFTSLDIKITSDMVGMNLHDVIEIAFLQDKENYIEVNEDIHLTYWM